MYNAISTNKRNTIFIMALFVGLIGAVGWAVSVYFGNTNITYWVIGVALVYALLQYVIADKIAMVMTGAHEIEKRDNPRLYRIVENLAITYGMDTPRIYIIDDSAPNAMATGRNPKHAMVAATSGILDMMDDRELTAVMAHEMGHVKNYDIRVSMIAFGLVSAISVLTDIVARMFFFGGNRRENNSDTNPVFMIIGIIVIILAPILAAIIQLAISRQREYLADATGALTIHDPEGLADALEKLKTYGRPMQRQSTATAHLFLNDPLKPGMLAKLFSTHPPLDDRIARLRNNANKF